jgi:hypothetical protein
LVDGPVVEGFESVPAADEGAEVGADGLAAIFSGVVVVDVSGGGRGRAGARVDGVRGAGADM